MQAQGIWSASEGDDTERFLADLRALRDMAAIGQDELAARTHYPDNILKDAESGPTLPGLPVLAAYVRACDGDVPAWEERWRRLGLDLHSGPGLPARAPGASPAAVAGARASAGVAQPEAYDPDRIRAVLRGIHHSDRGTRSGASRGSAAAAGRAGSGWASAEPQTQKFQPGWSAGTSRDGGWGAPASPDRASTPDATPPVQPAWDTGFQPDAGPHREDDTINLNGALPSRNHQLSPSPDASATEAPDEAGANTIRRDPFSAGWLPGSEPESPPVTESGWRDHADAGLSPAAADSWFTPHEPGSREPGRTPADADAAQSWFTPGEQADAGLAPSPPARHDATPPEDSGVAAADVTAFRSPADEPTVARSSWSGPAQTPPAQTSSAQTSSARTSSAGTPATVTPVTVTPASGIPVAEDRTESAALSDVSAEPSRPAAAHAVAPGPASPSRERRPDRLYLVWLLVVIVVAALIGSALVLLLR